DPVAVGHAQFDARHVIRREARIHWLGLELHSWRIPVGCLAQIETVALRRVEGVDHDIAAVLSDVYRVGAASPINIGRSCARGDVARAAAADNVGMSIAGQDRVCTLPCEYGAVAAAAEGELGAVTPAKIDHIAAYRTVIDPVASIHAAVNRVVAAALIDDDAIRAAVGIDRVIPARTVQDGIGPVGMDRISATGIDIGGAEAGVDRVAAVRSVDRVVTGAANK